MAAYFVATYDVSNPEEFAKYTPGSMPTIMKTLAKHGGKPLVAGPGAEWIAGGKQVAVVIEFPSVEAAKAWEEDPEYAPVKQIRLASTTNITTFIAPQFQPPS